jgi:hypothetical protein
MARTFRFRHCPSLPGTATHFAFTSGSNNWQRRGEIILETAKRLAPDVFFKVHDEPYLPWWKGLPTRQQEADARSILDVLENQVLVPLMSPHAHPWRRRYAINIRLAQYYRKKAHRHIRRISKQLLNRSPGDYEDMLMPMWYEHWNRRDIT